MANRWPALFEFLCLCLHLRPAYIEFRKHALDILANISRKMQLKLLNEARTNLLVISLTHLLIGGSDQQSSARPNEQQQGAGDGNGNSSSTPTMSNTIGASLLGGQDHLDIIRGLEILTKLCSQTVDPFDEENSNERCIARYAYKTNNETANNQNNDGDADMNESSTSDQNHDGLFIEKVIYRLEELLSIQDVLILLHALECLYQLSQNSKYICGIMVDYPASAQGRVSKMVPILVNFLTVDMTHFGMQQPPVYHPQQQQVFSTHPTVILPSQPSIVVAHQQQQQPVVTSINRAMPSVVTTANSASTGNANGPIKMYKIVPSSGVATLIASSSASGSSQTAVKTGGATLLQQTLNNNQANQQQQHQIVYTMNGGNLVTGGGAAIQKVINTSMQQQQVNQLINCE
jgi:hypothetical protein